MHGSALPDDSFDWKTGGAMYEFKGKTLTPYQATDKVIEYLRKGIKDPDVLRLARELSNE